ncbi:MAG: DUF2844 domain-containing protein [Proteobacteria bacterium]|nr:DUF2844 domain-containing protein [Pseudomonadota bacterium]
MKFLFQAPVAAALLFIPLMLVLPRAHAALGENVASISRDHRILHAQSQSVTHRPAYERHEMTTTDGIRIREYAASDGTIFAVTWSGRTQPDLKTMLNGYYKDYTDAATRHTSGHHVLVASTPELQLRIVKLQRGFVGSARVPALTPVGVNPSDIE